MLASCCKSGSASAMIQGSTGHRTQRKKAYVAYVALSWGHVFCLLPLKAPPSARKRSQPGRDLSRSPPETRKRSRSARSRGRNRNAPVRPSRGRSYASLGKVRRSHSAARSVANSEDYNELKEGILTFQHDLLSRRGALAWPVRKDFLAADQAPRTKSAKAKKAPKNPPEREAPRPSLSRRRQPEDPPCRKRRKRVHLVPNPDAMRSAPWLCMHRSWRAN
eukprot:s2749_g1.t1